MKVRILSLLLAAAFLVGGCAPPDSPPPIRTPSSREEAPAPSPPAPSSARAEPSPPPESASAPSSGTLSSREAPSASVSSDKAAPAKAALSAEPSAPPPAARGERDGSYGRSTLPAELRAGYDALEAAVLARQEEARVSITGEEALTRVLTCIRRDHPEVSWLDDRFSYSSSPQEDITSVRLKYTMDADRVKALTDALNRAAAEWTVNIDASLADFDKAVILYDRLCERVEYDLSAPRQSELTGALLDGRAGCGGYSRAYQYLLGRVGVEALIVYGTADEPHAWNMVRLDGGYYCADPTWGDAKLADGTGFIDHSWLVPDAAWFSKTHTALEDGTNYPLPVCVSAEDYFLRTGTLVTSFDGQGFSAALDAAFLLASANGYSAAQVAFPEGNPPAALLADGTLDEYAQKAAVRRGMDIYGRTADDSGLLISYLISR